MNTKTTILLALGVAATLTLARAAAAWEPLTHAGITEQAATASNLHHTLVANARPLGLFDGLRLVPQAGDDDLLRRLSLLDHEGGYGTDIHRLSALGWLVAGAVIEDAPVERQRHHFYAPPASAMANDAFSSRVARWQDGLDSLRGLIAGGAGHPYPAPEWLLADRSVNEWGLARFLDERERAASLPTMAARGDAWARALLAAGGIVHLVEDAGDPAHARGDLAAAPPGTPSFTHWVALQLGRLGIPAAPSVPPALPTSWAGFWHDPQSSVSTALGDLAVQLYSSGTLPAQTSDIAPRGARGYVTGRVPHLLSYVRTASGVQYGFDEACFRDYAQLLLPATVGTARVALDRLFRGDLTLAVDGPAITVTVAELALGAGKVSLFIDALNGERHLLVSNTVSGGRVGATLLTIPAPSDASELRLTALFRGVDGNGEPTVVTREQLLIRK